MTRQQIAIRFVLIGLLVGLVGNILFYGKVIGLSFPLFILILVAAALGIYLWAGHSLHLRNLWPLVPILFFAAMVAVHAAPTLTLWNVAAVTVLGLLTLHYLPVTDRHIDADSLGHYLLGALDAVLSALAFGALPEITDSYAEVKTKRPGQSETLGAVLRGLVFALPVLLVFGVLLGSADAVFGDYIRKFFEAISLEGLDDLVGQAVLILVIAWPAIGGLAYGAARRRLSRPPEAGAQAAEADSADADATTETPAPAFRLGIIEASIILGGVDLLFGAFVAVQFAYFFGGRTNISVEGLTYAEYARRGFFELVAVSVLVLGLSLVLDAIIARRHGVFRALVVVMVAFTLVMLVSAAQRMTLYEEVYGLTHLRVYTHIFIVWLGILLGAFLLELFRLRENIFSFSVLLVAIGYLATLNIANVDYLIAAHNTHPESTEVQLDTRYLGTLSVDAVPAIASLYETSQPDTPTYRDIGEWLARQLYSLDELRSGAGATLFSAHLSRERAWARLDAMRDSLPLTRVPPLYREW
ncbi:MAG: DUF4173 domain-containing protein [Anaerolineae bacterium]|nr:DUF4173 domain-containing protein [Anaerolineae bacterium]